MVDHLFRVSNNLRDRHFLSGERGFNQDVYKRGVELINRPDDERIFGYPYEGKDQVEKVRELVLRENNPAQRVPIVTKAVLGGEVAGILSAVLAANPDSLSSAGFQLAFAPYSLPVSGGSDQNKKIPGTDTLRILCHLLDNKDLFFKGVKAYLEEHEIELEDWDQLASEEPHIETHQIFGSAYMNNLFRAVSLELIVKDQQALAEYLS